MDPKSSKSSVWGHDDLPMLTRAVSISSMPMVNKETLQLWHLKRELQEDWCTGRGIPSWIWLPMSHSLNIPKAERSRYISETDIISAGCGFSSRTYLPRIFKLKLGCTLTGWWEKMAEKVTLEDKKQD